MVARSSHLRAEWEAKVALRAIRGAVRLSADDFDEMRGAVADLLREVMVRNVINEDAFVSVIFTCTPDLHCGFPATAAREIGFASVPLMCAQEMDVPDGMSLVVRMMAHVELDSPRELVRHVFLRGAESLRQDLADG